jgi:restriction endonuclease S subunit
MGEWILHSLGELIEVQNGYAFKSKDFDDFNGTPVIKIKNVASGELRMDDIKYYPHKIEGLEGYVISKYDILIGLTGSLVNQPSSIVGKVARYKKNEVSLLNQRVGKIYSLDERVTNEDYIYWFFKQWEVTLELALNAGGSANQANISGKLIKSLELYLPSLPEQKAIASVLSSIDDKIDLLHRQNKTLEAMAETLFRQWFIEEAREDWEEVSLGDIATVQNGYAFSSRDYIEHQIDHLEVFKMGHIEPGGGLRYSPKTDFVPRAEKLKKWILSEGDIVMAMTDMKDSMGILGHPAMIDKSDTYVLNQRVARIYLNSNECLINNHFLYLQLKTDVAIAIIQSKAHGGVQVNLSTEAIRSIPIIVPLEPDQEKGFKLLEGYLLKSQNNRKQIRTLEKLRDTLLPKLMSGEVRVQYNKETTA